MLPDWPHDNNGCCFIMSQLAQWRPPRRYTEILNSNLPNGKSMVLVLGLYQYLLTIMNDNGCSLTMTTSKL